MLKLMSGFFKQHIKTKGLREEQQVLTLEALADEFKTLLL